MPEQDRKRYMGSNGQWRFTFKDTPQLMKIVKEKFRNLDRQMQGVLYDGVALKTDEFIFNPPVFNSITFQLATYLLAVQPSFAITPDEAKQNWHSVGVSEDQLDDIIEDAINEGQRYSKPAARAAKNIKLRAYLKWAVPTPIWYNGATIRNYFLLWQLCENMPLRGYKSLRDLWDKYPEEEQRKKLICAKHGGKVSEEAMMALPSGRDGSSSHKISSIALQRDTRQRCARWQVWVLHVP